jgi:DNA polymerase III delta subunit
VNTQTIEMLIDPSPSENVFQLFETALSGDTRQVRDALQTLELTEDPYQLFALLSSQAFQLAGVGLAGEGQDASKDLAIHPFVASKLARHARKMGKSGVRRVLRAFANADADMKRSRGEPWLLIEKALIESAPNK